MARNGKDEYDWLDDPFNDKKTNESKLGRGNTASKLLPLLALIVIIVVLLVLFFPVVVVYIGSGLAQ